MQIIHLSQQADREAWLEARRTLITGSKAKGVKRLSRGADRTPAGFWELVSEHLSIAKDGEPERDRGQRLENQALAATAKEYGIVFNIDPGMWISDEDTSIAVSPDGAEPGNKPTYAGEVKCLDSKNHIKAIVMDMRAKKKDDYNPFDSLKIDAKMDFQDQVLQYFVVNELLEKLYFTLHDDRMAFDNLVNYVIVINRSDVQDLIDKKITEEKSILEEVRALVKELTDGQL